MVNWPSRENVSELQDDTEEAYLASNSPLTSPSNPPEVLRGSSSFPTGITPYAQLIYLVFVFRACGPRPVSYSCSGMVMS